MDAFEQLLRIQAVASTAIGSGLARCGCVGNQAAFGRVHLRQSTTDAAKFSLKWVIAAGVQNDDVHRAHRQLVHDGVDIHGFYAHTGLTGDLGVHGNDVVLAPDLYSVAGVEEQGHGVASQFFTELCNGPVHVFLVRVRFFNDIEAEFAQRGCHVSRIVDRVFEGRVFIGAVANDQCDSFALDSID